MVKKMRARVRKYGRSLKRRLGRRLKRYAKRKSAYASRYRKRYSGYKRRGYRKSFRRGKGRQRRVLKISNLRATLNAFANLPKVFGIYNTKALMNKDNFMIDNVNMNPGVYELLFREVPVEMFQGRELDKIFDTGIHNIQVIMKSNNLRIFNPDKRNPCGFRLSFFKPCIFSYKSFCGLNELFNANRTNLCNVLAIWLKAVPIFRVFYENNDDRPTITWMSFYDMVQSYVNAANDMSVSWRWAAGQLGSTEFLNLIKGLIKQRWTEMGGVGCVSRHFLILDDVGNASRLVNMKVPSEAIMDERGDRKPWPAANIAYGTTGADPRTYYIKKCVEYGYTRRRELGLQARGNPADLAGVAALLNRIVVAGIPAAARPACENRTDSMIVAPEDNIVDIPQFIRDMSLYTLCHGLSELQQQYIADFFAVMITRCFSGGATTSCLYNYLNDYFQSGARDNLVFEPIENLVKAKLCKVKKVVNDKVYKYKPKGATNIAFFVCCSGSTIDHTLKYGFDRRILKHRVYEIIEGGDKSLVGREMMEFLNKNALVNKLAVK